MLCTGQRKQLRRPTWRQLRAIGSTWPSAVLKLGPASSALLLTLLGITVGVAAVISLLTIGRYAREKILASYADLGVANYRIYGYKNWSTNVRKNGSHVSMFDDKKDLNLCSRFFRRFAAIHRLWNSARFLMSYGGRTIKSESHEGA